MAATPTSSASVPSGGFGSGEEVDEKVEDSVSTLGSSAFAAFGSSDSGEEDVTKDDLHETVLKSCGVRMRNSTTEWYNQRIEQVESFALIADQTAQSLKARAKALGFVITASGKAGTRDERRVYSGLPAKARNIIKEKTLCGKVPRSFFRFNRHQDGLFHASSHNSDAIEEYLRYRKIYRAYTGTNAESDVGRSVDSVSSVRRRRDPKIWCADDTKTLIAMRCTDNPSTFRQIALALNRTHEVVGTVIDRRFEAQDCMNKWSRMFPSAMDANKTLEYVKSLQKKWPGLVFKTRTEKCNDNSRAPTLIALHVVWPWAADLMATLSPSIFCDATYKVTLYHYKVVMITTLDGNRHHRPLMVSFIMSSDIKTWREIFDIFGRVVRRRVEQVYVVTSDAEIAIRGGLESSALRDASTQILCGLHAKWNVSAHKYVNVSPHKYMYHRV